MKKRLLLLMLLMAVCLPVFAAAHSGRTDSNGGHNSDYGYHYHHGYPEHQHINGQCPYDFDDQTGRNSGKSGGGTSKEKDTDSSIKMETASSQEEPSESGIPVIGWIAIIIMLIPAVPVVIIYVELIFSPIISFVQWVFHRKKK